MNKFCERLRYSVGGTYLRCGPRQMPESRMREAYVSFYLYSWAFLCVARFPEYKFYAHYAIVTK